MLLNIARFETRYQLTSPIFWITSLIFFLLTFAIASLNGLPIGWGGHVVRNSPHAIALLSMIMSIYAIFIVTTFVSNVIVRDDETGFGPIIQATRISKVDYVFGRFAGAFATSCLVFLSVPLGAATGAAMPWVDPETVGPFRFAYYLYPYLALCAPTLFVLGAGLFSLTAATRSMFATYVAGLVVLMLYFLMTGLAARSELTELAALLDPFGLSAFSHETNYWTPVERNERLAPLVGTMLYNRILWLSVAVAVLAASVFTFRFEKSVKSKRRKSLNFESEAKRDKQTKRLVPPPAPGRRSLGWAPLFALARFDVFGVLRNPAFVVLVGIALIMAVVGLWYAGDDATYNPLPVTRLMIQALHEQFALIPLIISAYYAGELVWRERERRINEVLDATPAADWAFVIPKILAIALVLFALGLASIAAAIGVQTVKGYTNYEPGHYFTWYLLPWLLTMVQYAILAVFVQMLAPNKYVGLLITLLIVVAQLALASFGFDHNLYRYANTSAVPLSDMNGLGDFGVYAAWYRAYWTACATILAVLAYILWRRGVTAPFAKRLKIAAARLKGAPGLIASAAAVLMVALGGLIFYNTNILNDYRSRIEGDRMVANYEKTLLDYESVPLPQITDVKVDVDLYPDQSKLAARGYYIIENKTDAPLKEVHVSWPWGFEGDGPLGESVTLDVKMLSLEVTGARLSKEYPEFNYQIYTFDEPMAPGARAEIRFEALREQRGFRNNLNDFSVVENGTFTNNYEFLPLLGVNRFLLLSDRNKRRRYGLTPVELRPPSLEDESARAFQYFRRDADWVNLDMTVSTSPDQTVVAPGRLIDERVVDGRRVFHFRSDAPTLYFFSIHSARYEVREDKWNDVDLAVYYHPEHDFVVDEMLKSTKASIAYYSQNFSPYQFQKFQIVEFPAYRNYAQAYPGSIAYSEAAGFIFDDSTKEKAGIAYVTAHEAAHQWWAHQVIGADMQGQTVLSEVLAQYSAFMIVEKMYGAEEARRLLKSSLRGYLSGRSNDLTGEVPLERVENQFYIRYPKGALVMYLLKDVMGEDAVNSALRALIDEYGLKGPPYPTSRDLIKRLRAEAGPEHQQLITDLFEHITLYDFKAAGGRVEQLPNGEWSVSIDIDASKFYADEKGVETEAPLDAFVDIGIFTSEPGSPRFNDKDVLYLQHHRVRSGQETITVTVDQEPQFVGIDPYLKYIDRNADNNIMALKRE